MFSTERTYLEQEEQKVVSHIILEFMRHGRKEKVEGKDDYDIRLIPEARVDAKNKGQRLGVQAEVSVAYGSPRKRAQEAATRVMLGNELDITDDMSLEEIEEEVADYMKLGKNSSKKIVAEELLDFTDNTKDGLEAYLAGRTMVYMIRESDNLALERNDKELTSYTRAAGNIAEIVAKWVGVGKNFNKIVEKKPEKYAEFKNQLERYFGSHQGVLESFLLKVVEKIGGVEARDEVLALMPAGFKELQGFRIDIENQGKGMQVIHLSAEVGDKKINLELTQELLEEMIEERDVFNEKFKN